MIFPWPKFAVTVQRKIAILTALLTESEDEEFKVESMIQTMTDVKRADKADQLHQQLAIHKLMSESLRKQISEVQ